MILLKLRQRYGSLHPLLFSRSVEKAKTVSELFDILDTVPDLPVTWDETKRRWVSISDPLLSKL